MTKIESEKRHPPSNENTKKKEKTMIVADSRWVGPHGIGRFAQEVFRLLPEVKQVNLPLPLLNPLDPIILSAWLYFLKPSCFFSPGFNPPLLCPVPFVFTVHDLVHIHFDDEKNMTKKLYYEGIVKPAIKRARFVLTVSEFSKRQILDWSDAPEEKIIVVGNGVGKEFCILGKKFTPGYPYLFYVGNHKPHKNLKNLLIAFSMSNIDKKIRLLLTGHANPQLLALASSLGIKDRLRFLGLLPNEELPAYYRGALGFVFPSLYEGFGIPPLEAMACGTPVLVSNVTSLPEIVGDAGLYVDPMDVQTISSAIQVLVEDNGLRSRLQQKGLERIQLFSWEKTAGIVSKSLLIAAEDGI